MKEIGRRAKLAMSILRAGAGRRREVALFSLPVGGKTLAKGIVGTIGLCGVRIGNSFVPWSEIERVERWPDTCCANCLREHGPLQECFVGVIAGVLVDREGREIAPDVFARIPVDVMWDRFGGPAADWLERHLDQLEAEDAV